MSPRRVRRVTTGLILLAAALGMSLFSFVLGSLWTGFLASARPPEGVASSLRTFWMPLSELVVGVATGLLGALGFLFAWRGRHELGGAYATRAGLALLAALVAGVAYALYALTGVLLDSFGGLSVLVPWHGLLAAVGGVAVGLGLYWTLASLPVAGTRPVAAVAFGLGFAGIVLLNLSTLDLHRPRLGAFGLEGAGLGLALASLTLWLVLCLWSEESLRNRPSAVPGPAASHGS